MSIGYFESRSEFGLPEIKTPSPWAMKYVILESISTPERMKMTGQTVEGFDKICNVELLCTNELTTTYISSRGVRFEVANDCIEYALNQYEKGVLH